MICIAEDRILDETGVKLLLRSLTKWCAEQPVMLWFPCADAEFAAWLAHYPNITLMPGRLEGAKGWNIKPHAMLAALHGGAEEVWWIDSDVIVTKNFLQDYRHVPPGQFIVAEEALYGNLDRDGYRAREWGFQVRRPFPFCLNSGVMRASAAHVPLLEFWVAQLGSARYLAAQDKPASERPVHLIGDQDVLTACLSGPFADVPVRCLYRGKDIIQYFGPAGYTPLERLRHALFGLPAFIHSMGAAKPWRAAVPFNHRNAAAVFDALYAELSPYKAAAKDFKVDFGPQWAANDRRTCLGSLLRVFGFGNAALTGLPLALAYSASRWVKRIKKART